MLCLNFKKKCDTRRKKRRKVGATKKKKALGSTHFQHWTGTWDHEQNKNILFVAESREARPRDEDFLFAEQSPTPG